MSRGYRGTIVVKTVKLLNKLVMETINSEPTITTYTFLMTNIHCPYSSAILKNISMPRKIGGILFNHCPLVRLHKALPGCQTHDLVVVSSIPG